MFDLIFSDRKLDPRFVEKVDPRAKIILFICFVSAVLIIPANKLIPLAVFGSTIALLTIIAGLPVHKIFRAVLKIYPMIVMMTFFQLLTMNSGDYQHSGIGLLGISMDSWVRIAGFQIKTILILTASLLLISSTPIKLFLTSMERLKVPGWVVSLTFFIYHFVFILTHELTRLQIAYQSRYIKLPVMKRLIVQARLMAMFLTRVFERNDRLYDALISRGFNGVLPLHIPLSWKYSDTVIVLSGMTFLTMIQWIL